MSFDDTFIYTPAVDGLAEERANFASILATFTTELNLLQSATAYASEIVVINRIAVLNTEIARLTKNVNDIDEVTAEIDAITLLSSLQKDDLYYFYTVVGTTKQDFMAKMLFNYGAALSDQRIIDLRADAVTPVDAKTAVAKLIYDTYSVNSDRISAVMGIYRYIR